MGSAVCAVCAADEDAFRPQRVRAGRFGSAEDSVSGRTSARRIRGSGGGEDGAERGGESPKRSPPRVIPGSAFTIPVQQTQKGSSKAPRRHSDFLLSDAHSGGELAGMAASGPGSFGDSAIAKEKFRREREQLTALHRTKALTNLAEEGEGEGESEESGHGTELNASPAGLALSNPSPCSAFMDQTTSQETKQHETHEDDDNTEDGDFESAEFVAPPVRVQTPETKGQLAQILSRT